MFGRTVLGLAALATQTLAIATIQAKGAKFFTSNGNQFYLKGVAYQLSNDDPLVDATQCQLDANLMKTLGVNSIRVYHVDPAQNHDACMSTFSDAGIYIFVDLDTFSTYILPHAPAWTKSMHDAYATVMDVFQKYDNTAGFFVGNEVMNSGADSVAAPYVKAAAVDMKSYRDAKGYRKIPVGYSAADIPALRPNLQNYLACGSNPATALDFYSLNAYEWCGMSSFQTSGYAALQQNASEYNIPIFFSETGCIVPKPRFFTDQSAILGPDMDDTWSGAIIYEWIEEANDYGLISYAPAAATGAVEGFVRAGSPTPIQPDFDNLSNQWKTLNPTGVQMAAYTPSLSAPACPPYTSGLWEVNGDVPLPTLGSNNNANTITPAAPSRTTGGAAAISTSGSSGATSGTTSAGINNGVSGSSSQTSSGSQSASAATTAPSTSPTSNSAPVDSISKSFWIGGGILFGLLNAL